MVNAASRSVVLILKSCDTDLAAEDGPIWRGNCKVVTSYLLHSRDKFYMMHVYIALLLRCYTIFMILYEIWKRHAH